MYIHDKVILRSDDLLSALRRLLGLILALIGLVVGDWLRVIIENHTRIANWFKTAPPDQWIVGDSLIALIPGLLMTLTPIGSGLRREDVFLAMGKLTAPSKLPFKIRPIGWNWLGPILIVVLSIPFAMAIISAAPAIKKVVPALPLILAFAVINSGSEEFRFRAVLLGRIEPVMGAGHAVLLTSVLFGLGHWFGHPSGAVGVLLAGIAGWLWAKSMIETRGFFWAWLIHGIQDVLILSLVVMTST